MIDYIIAIDGGGTKTLGVLYDVNGNELKRIALGFSNFSIDEEKSKKTLKELIKLLIKGYTYKKLYVQMGVAGATKLSNKQAFIDEIETTFNAKANLVTDALICIYAIEKEAHEPLIMAIGGTGSAVLTYIEDKIHVTGGWGHLLGDEGSAYHLVISAIKNIIYEYEHNIPYSYLSKHLMKTMKIEDVYGIIEYVYNRDKSALAQLSLEVQEASKYDAYAKELLEKEGLYLATQIINAYNRYVKDKDVVISLRGSFSLKGLHVKESIITHLKNHIPKYRLDIDGHEPVYGAYVLAKINIERGV